MAECSLVRPHAGESQGLEQAESTRLWQRYGRQMLLPELGEAGQRRLQESRVLVVGLGGLGSAATLYLAAAGVGQIWLSDGDKLEVSNLQRQILYTSNDLFTPKNQLAAKRLKLLNPTVRLHPVPAWGEDNGTALLNPDEQKVDLVIDATDNMATRHAMNRACIAGGIPLLSAAATGWLGQLMLFDAPEKSGCYHCLYPDETEPETNCRNYGILGPVVGIMGTYQALEAIKFLAGIPSAIAGKLLRFDGLQGVWKSSRLLQDPACPVCALPEQKKESVNHEI